MIFPQNSRLLYESEDIIKIEISSKSNFIAVLTQKSVEILNNTKYSPQIIDKYERDDDSLVKYGANKWLQWISNDTIAFGTQKGSIFLYYFGSDISKKKMIEVHFNILITAQFSVFSKYLGLFFIEDNKNSFLFLSLNGTILFKNSLSLTGIITSSCFYKSNVLIFLSDSKPFLLNFSDLNNNDFSYDLVSFPFQNITCFDFNGSYLNIKNFQDPLSVLALIDSHNTLYLYNILTSSLILQKSFLNEESSNDNTNINANNNPNINNNINTINNNNNTIIHIEWIKSSDITLSLKEFLFILTSNGTMIIYDILNNSVHSTTLSLISNSISSKFDSTFRNLFISSPENKFFGIIEFAILQLSYAWTSSSIYNIEETKIIAQIPNSLPENLYPISKVIHSNSNYFQNIFIAVNNNGFIPIQYPLLSEDFTNQSDDDHQNKHFSFIEIPNLINIEFCNNYLFVFHQKDQDGIILSVYDENFELLGSLPFSHRPIFVNSHSIDQIAIGAHNQYSIITIRDQDQISNDSNNEIECKQIPGCRCSRCTEKSKWKTIGNQKKINLLIQSNFVQEQLINCDVSQNYGTILHFWSGNLIFPHHLNMYKSKIYCFLISNDPQIILLQSPDSFSFSVGGLSFSFAIQFQFSDGAGISTFSPSVPFGLLKYNSKIFGFYILSAISNQKSVLNYFHTSYCKHNSFLLIYSRALVFSYKYQKSKFFIDLLNTLEPIQEAQIFSEAFNFLSSTKAEQYLFLPVSNFNWNSFFMYLDVKIRVFIYTNCNPIELRNIFSKQIIQETNDICQNLINDLLNSGDFLRAFEINQYRNGDFMSYPELKNLSKFSFQESIDLIHKNISAWQSYDKNEYSIDSNDKDDSSTDSNDTKDNNIMIIQINDKSEKKLDFYIQEDLNILGSLLMINEENIFFSFALFIAANNSNKVKMLIETFPQLSNNLELFKEVLSFNEYYDKNILEV